MLLVVQGLKYWVSFRIATCLRLRMSERLAVCEAYRFFLLDHVQPHTYSMRVVVHGRRPYKNAIRASRLAGVSTTRAPASSAAVCLSHVSTLDELVTFEGCFSRGLFNLDGETNGPAY